MKSIDPPRETVWTSLPIAAITVSGEDRIISANPAAESLLNYSASALAGELLAEKLDVDPCLASSLSRARQGLAPVTLLDVVLRLDHRTPMVASVQIAPLSPSENQLLVCLQSREIEGRLGQGMQLRSVAKSAAGMAELLSHEIKNPLAGISSAAQLLAMSLARPDRELTDIIAEEIQRILVVIQQFEQFGSLGTMDLQPLNVHDTLERVSRSASLRLGDGKIIEKDFDPSLPLICADDDKLMRVFSNLLQNAAEAVSERGSTIRIRTYYNANLRTTQPSGEGKPLPVQVEIIDDGPGLPPGLAADIFEPFVTGKANGKGLGLALVSAILSESGGWITAESVPGHTVFRVSLPVAPLADGGF